MCDRREPFPDPHGSPFTGVMGPVEVQDLEPHEINLTISAIQRRLYSLAKLGIPALENVMDLPLEAFYPHCQAEVAVLQKAGEKLCRLNMEL